MDILANKLLNGPINDDVIHMTYQQMTKFINSYNSHIKIDHYTSKKVNVKSTKNNLLTIREVIYKIVRKASDLITDAQSEFTKPITSKFCIMKVISPKHIELMLLYSIFYYLDATHAKATHVVGLDFEFNQRKIALCQVGFFPIRKYKYIFVCDPNMFSTEQKTMMIKTIFTSPLYRVLHGGDSLDIPYIFEELLISNHDDILHFTDTMVDTRFLCEYHKIFTKSENKKCSIYDALLYFNVINKKKYDELNQINDSMGPVQDVNWNVKKMSSFHLKYASYDVFFLRQYIYAIYEKAIQLNPTMYYHLKYIPQITRFIYYEKYGLSNILNMSKTIVDPINNYIITLKTGNKTTLVAIYNDIIANLEIPSINMKIIDLLGINYFKTPLSLILKRIIYTAISENYVIYENKKDKLHTKLSFKEIYPTLDELNLGKLISFLERFYQECKNYL
jgi:hypothetical protein